MLSFCHAFLWLMGQYSCGVIQGVPAVVLLHGLQSRLESDGGIVQPGTQL